MSRTGFLLSRLAVEQYHVKLPPMGAARAQAALRYRLGALYPGDRAGARVDCLRNGGRRGDYLVFAIDDAALEALRAEAGGRALLAPSLVAGELAPRGRSRALFWSVEWASLEILEDGFLLDSKRARRGGDDSEVLRRLLAPSPPDDAGSLLVVLADESPGARDCLEAKLDELGIAGRAVMALPAALARARVSRAEIFPLKPRTRRSRTRALLALLVVDLVLAIAAAALRLGSIESQLASERERYLGLQRRSGEALRLADEIAAKESRYAALAAEEVPDMYGLIASVAASLGPGCRIVGLEAKEGGLRLEAEAPDALACLASLEGACVLESPRLHQSAPLTGGVERFTMSGRYGPREKGAPK